MEWLRCCELPKSVQTHSTLSQLTNPNLLQDETLLERWEFGRMTEFLAQVKYHREGVAKGLETNADSYAYAMSHGIAWLRQNLE
eukprot:scaffold34524_cov73-Cyclotella_meneghiniana.AAC.8